MPEFIGRISTVRTAIFRLKRWFYATFFSPFTKFEEGKKIAEENRRMWVMLASKIINEISSKYGSDANLAARIRLTYDSEVVSRVTDPSKGQEIEIRKFIPRKVVIEVYEKKGDIEFDITESDIKEALKGGYEEPKVEES
ncbi:MAG: hypothetical protein DRJ66_02790 [Thermoprotei archaeon]|nr:MAG: hypothetical protein DRJ66_02790 [Thermoprotei archaeon]RLF20657.1 MAG: hypothetical protein DRZ82_01390 [Thermoprotei archaeon]